jgi:hydroxymethylglutaryl-CoA synthase
MDGGRIQASDRIGIVSYGACIPRLRIKTEEIAKVWGKDGEAMARGLNVHSKSVPSWDEDVITIAVTAARRAMYRANLDPSRVGAVYVGSESHPYAVKPTATIVAEAIRAAPNLTAADFEFACKAGTAAIQAAMGLSQAGIIDLGIGIGADTSQGAPGDALEYSASAGGAAFVIGRNDLIATINHTCSFTTDTPDFWRREGEHYPSHGGRFTGVPSYFRHVVAAASMCMDAVKTKPEDYHYAVLHQPNGKFPVRAAKQIGFNDEQIKDGLLTPVIGNTYSASMPLGLAAILDKSKPGDRIFACAYGSGAGADAFDITVTEGIGNIQRKSEETVQAMVADAHYIGYAEYAKLRGKILMAQ